MSEEEIREAEQYNLEYMEAMNSEEIFGGDYTSAIELKYANKKIEQLQQENNVHSMVIKQLQEKNDELRKQNVEINLILVKLKSWLEKLHYNNICVDDVFKKIEKLEGSDSNE